MVISRDPTFLSSRRSNKSTNIIWLIWVLTYKTVAFHAHLASHGCAGIYEWARRFVQVAYHTEKYER